MPTKQHRSAVITWVKERTVEEQKQLLGQLEVQADYLKWEGIMSQDFSWNTLIYRMRSAELKSYLQGMIQMAPTPNNLRK